MQVPEYVAAEYINAENAAPAPVDVPTKTTPAPVAEYNGAAPAVFTTSAPAVLGSPAPVIKYLTSAPAIEHVASVPVIEYVTKAMDEPVVQIVQVGSQVQDSQLQII